MPLTHTSFGDEAGNMQPSFFRKRHALMIVFLAVSRFAIAAEPSNEGQQAISEVREASLGYLKALTVGKRDDIAAFWTSSGVFVDLYGKTLNAQTRIKEEFSEAKATEISQELSQLSSKMRVISSAVVLEYGTLTPPLDGTQVGFMAMWVHRDGRWKLDFAREYQQLAEPAAEELDSPLSDLDWLVGEWQSVGEDDGPNAHISVTRSDDRKFLLQKYVVRTPGQREVRGEGRIAWDAANSKLRSWLFRADGAILEGTWERRGDTWLVRENGVLADGERVSTVNLWAYDAPNTCWFKTHRARVGTEEFSDLTLEFQRVTTP